MYKAASSLELANIYIRHKTFKFFRSAIAISIFVSFHFVVLHMFPLLAQLSLQAMWSKFAFKMVAF